MADANKTLITRAEVTSVITPTVGRTALVLDGATREIGDTGLRDLSGLFEPGSVTSGQVKVRRIGYVIEWQFINIVLPTSAQGQTIMSNAGVAAGALTAFLPAAGDRLAVGLIGSDTARARVSVAGTIQIQYGEAAVVWNATVTFLAERAWPTSLPGVADGQPVGV